MARPKPSLKQTRALLNRLTLGLVSVLGFFATASILTAPSTLALRDTVSESSTDASLSMDRQPAAIIKGGDGGFVPDRRGIQVIKVGCDPEIHLEKDTNQIRLRGKVCAEEAVTIEKSTITNSDHQDVATVFHKDKSYTTDVIHLRPGQNRLIISNHLSDGSISQQILNVQRATASVKK